MIGNPRGYGKSALIAEMAYRRNKICEKMKIPSGPVLFTDFEGIANSSDAKTRILETIQPLFFTLFSFFQVNKARGNFVCCVYFLSFSVVITYVYVTFIYLRIDELSHKLKLLKEVSLELSQGNDEKVVMWVLDSFSPLVSNATAALDANNTPSVAAYSGVITTLFDLNTAIIPIAVCSSATAAGKLSESK